MSLSIVTPSFNQGEFIEETILSVKNQDYEVIPSPQSSPPGGEGRVRGIEHIVIDGGSTDGTIGILRKYPYLSWISEPDKGQADAINKGFKMAKGEIVAWLNSDDTYLQGSLSVVCEYFAAHPDVDMVFGDCNKIDQDGKTIGAIKGHPFNLTHLIPRNCIPQPAAFFKRFFLERIGCLDTGYRHAFDYDYWIRIGLAGGKIDYLPKTLANFRLHEGSKTCREMDVQHREEAEIAKIYARRIGAKYGVVVKNLEELIKEEVSRVLIYGTGRSGEGLYSILRENNFEILGFMDSDKEKWGKNFLDNKVLSFDEAKTSGCDAILIASQLIKEIKDTLEKNGITENIIAPIISWDK